MLFLRSPPYSWWFVLYKKSTKMSDYQLNLESWLQDASLFRNEPLDYAINFDDFLNEKANIEGFQATLSLPDIGWFDEKVDLSVFDNPGSLLDYPDDTEKLMDDDAAILLGLIDGGLDSSYLPSDSLKITDIDLNNCLNSQNFMEPISSEILDSHLASPGCTTLQVHSPAFFPAQSPASPYSGVSETPEEEAAGVSETPEEEAADLSETPEKEGVVHFKLETSSVTSDLADTSDCSIVHVSVYENVTSPASSSDEVMSIEEVSQCVRKRKFVSDGDYIPKVKVILKELPQTSSKGSKPKDRRERKKIQNKEAAARYRIKKRIEDKELSDEISGLESTQKELKEKHASLESEIKYLKNLMCEILQKKGILK